MNAAGYPQELLALAEVAVRSHLPRENEAPGALREAMEYSLLAGGKRLRPVLCLAAAQALGAEPGSVTPLAAAIEFIHTYSLIHDDLPALDNDEIRRGKPTCHIVHGEDIAIMAGDALLTEAFTLVAREQRCEPADRLGMVLSEMGEAAGHRGMVGGQVLDIKSGGSGDIGLLRKIHSGKTAALIAFSAASPAMALGAPESVISGMKRFGHHMGIAFQIVDDILDETGTVEELGKTPGSDRRLDKLTYVSLRGLEQSREDARIEAETARKALRSAGESLEAAAGAMLAADVLLGIADFVLERNA